METSKFVRVTRAELAGNRIPIPELRIPELKRRLSCFDRDDLLSTLSAFCACLRNERGTGGCIEADRELLALLAPPPIVSAIKNHIESADSRSSETPFPSRRVVFSAQQLLFLQQLLAGLPPNPAGAKLDDPRARLELLRLVIAANDHLGTESARLGQEQEDGIILPDRNQRKLAEIACELLPMNDVENLPDFAWLVCIYVRMILDSDEKRLFASEPGREDFSAYCRQHFSLTPEELVIFGFAWHCAYAEKQKALLCGEGGALTHIEMTTLRKVLGEKADTFTKAMSATPEEITQRISKLHTERLLREPCAPTHLYVRAFQERPLLRLGPDTYRPSFVPFILDRTTRGILLDISEEKEGDKNAAANWGNFLGRLFEHQMRERFAELSARCPDSSRCRVYRTPHLVGPGFEQSLGDAALLTGRTLHVFEFKSRFMGMTLRLSPTPSALEHDLRRNILKVKDDRPQLACRIKEFLDGKGTLEGMASSAVTKVYPIIVCLDTAYTSPLVNALACRLFARASGGIQTEKIAGLTIMTPRDVSYVLASLPGVDLAEMLSRRLRTWSDLMEPFWNFLRCQGLTESTPRIDAEYYEKVRERLFRAIPRESREDG